MPGPGAGHFPDFVAPRYTAPNAFVHQPFVDSPPLADAAQYQPGTFSHPGFNAPTLSEAELEPGYAFAKREGLGAIRNKQAALGTFRTGGAVKGLIGWANRFAEQNYGNVYNRAGQTYDRNRGNAFENFLTNETSRKGAFDTNRANVVDTYQRNRDNRYAAYQANQDNRFNAWDANRVAELAAYDREFQGAQDEFNQRYRTAEITFDDMYRRWRDTTDTLTRVAATGAGT